MAPHENRLERVKPLWVITGVLGVWGAYLAVGATNLFTPENTASFDIRKFFVVAACSVTFLAFWWANVRFARKRQSTSTTTVSTSSVVAFVLSLVAYGLWGWAHQVDDGLAMRIGLVSALLLGCSMIAAMIGISDRAPKSARWAGYAAFAMFLLAIVLFVMQVRAFAAQ